jgi:hypothetical protein
MKRLVAGWWRLLLSLLRLTADKHRLLVQLLRLRLLLEIQLD